MFFTLHPFIFILDYQALWFMQRVIKELNEVCLNHDSIIQNHLPILPSVLWSSFVLKNSRRQMEDYIAVIPYLHTMFNIKVCNKQFTIHNLSFTSPKSTYK